MDMIVNFLMSALDPLRGLILEIMAVLPGIIAGVLLLFVGTFAAHWIRYFTERVLRMAKLDDHFRRVGLSQVLNRLGLGPSLTNLICVVVHGVIILSFLLGAAGAMGFPIVSEYLRRVLIFGPKLVSALLVLGGGFFLGDLVGRIVYRASEANQLRGSEALMRVTHGLLVIFSGVMALEVLGIDVRLFLDHLQIIIAAIGLGCAIAFGVAFGLAGRDMAEKWIRDLTPKSAKGSGESHEPKMRVVR